MIEIERRKIVEFLDALAGADPTPGGGSAAAVSGALSAALGSMVLSVAQKRRDAEDLSGPLTLFRRLCSSFLQLASDDESAFACVIAAFRAPKDQPKRQDRIDDALISASEVPIRVAEACVELLEALESVISIAPASIISDVGVAAHLARAALGSALLGLDANLASLRRAERIGELRAHRASLASNGELRAQRILTRVSEAIDQGCGPRARPPFVRSSGSPHPADE